MNTQAWESRSLTTRSCYRLSQVAQRRGSHCPLYLSLQLYDSIFLSGGARQLSVPVGRPGQLHGQRLWAGGGQVRESFVIKPICKSIGIQLRSQRARVRRQGTCFRPAPKFCACVRHLKFHAIDAIHIFVIVAELTCYAYCKLVGGDNSSSPPIKNKAHLAIHDS